MRTIRLAVASTAAVVAAVSVLVTLPTQAQATARPARALSPPAFKSSTTANARVAKPFRFTVRAKGNPKPSIETIGALPFGISLIDLGTGRARISGSFAHAGLWVISLKATNSQGSQTQSLTVSATGVGGAYCGFKSGPPTTSKVMVIYEENHDFSSIIGSRTAPNINAYANTCSVATDYQSLTHPSLPNYLASTSGVSYAISPWTSDCDPTPTSCTTGNSNIFNQVGAAGWKGYAESMSSNCQTSSSGTYATKHNPAPYYTDLGSACAADDVPLGTITSGNLFNDVVNGTLPTFATVTPDLNDDMHDGTIAQGDAWLSTWIPVITAGPNYQSGDLVIIVVWDEGSGSGNSASTVPMIVMSPYVVPGTKSATYFTHYSTLKAAEDVAGVPELGSAATANSLRSAFGF